MVTGLRSAWSDLAAYRVRRRGKKYFNKVAVEKLHLVVLLWSSEGLFLDCEEL